MPAPKFVRVYDVRTRQILPDPVPEHWIGAEYAKYLKPVPSSGKLPKADPEAAPVLEDNIVSATDAITDKPNTTTQADTAPAADAQEA